MQCDKLADPCPFINLSLELTDANVAAAVQGRRRMIQFLEEVEAAVNSWPIEVGAHTNCVFLCFYEHQVRSNSLLLLQASRRHCSYDVEVKAAVASAQMQVQAALADDFDTAGALTALFSLIKHVYPVLNSAERRISPWTLQSGGLRIGGLQYFSLFAIAHCLLISLIILTSWTHCRRSGGCFWVKASDAVLSQDANCIRHRSSRCFSRYASGCSISGAAAARIESRSAGAAAAVRQGTRCMW